MIDIGKNTPTPAEPLPQATADMQTVQEESEKEQKSPLSKVAIIIFGFFALLVVSEVGYLAYINSDQNKHLRNLAGTQEEQIAVLQKYVDQNLFDLFTKCPSCSAPEQFTKPLNVQKGENFFNFIKTFDYRTEFIEEANINFSLSGYVTASETEVSDKGGVQTVWKLAIIPENVTEDRQIVNYRFTQEEMDNSKVILINTEDKKQITVQEIPLGTFVQMNFKLNLLDSSENYEILLTVW